MILYSVTVAIDAEVEDDWYQWMTEHHIPDVLKTGCFISATIDRILEPESRRPTYRIEYRCRDAASYRAYVARDASTLQEDHTQRYEGRFSASRRLLAPRESFSVPGPGKADEKQAETPDL